MRFVDWEARMRAMIAEAEGQPFVYGVHDCCLFAGDLVLAVTGRDPMVAFRDTYRTPREAVKVMQGLGGLHAELTRQFGEPIAPADVHIGDLVGFSRHAVGMVTGTYHAAAVMREGGVLFLPPSFWRTAWRVV